MLKKHLLVLSAIISLSASLTAQVVETNSPDIHADIKQYSPEDMRDVLFGDEVSKLQFVLLLRWLPLADLLPRERIRLTQLNEFQQLFKVCVRNNSNSTLLVERGKYISTLANATLDFKKLGRLYPKLNKHLAWRRVYHYLLLVPTLIGCGAMMYGAAKKNLMIGGGGLAAAFLFGLNSIFTGKSVNHARKLRDKLNRLTQLLPRVNGKQIKSNFIALEPGDVLTDKMLVNVPALQADAMSAGAQKPAHLVVLEEEEDEYEDEEDEYEDEEDEYEDEEDEYEDEEYETYEDEENQDDEYEDVV
jgi:hypothetical protein